MLKKAAKKVYINEREGQIDFFDNYRIPYGDDNSILVDNTDGVYHGNILEFKLNINNTGKVLFQAIKYLSRMRIKGESIPARILLIDLNATKVYVYKSADYLDDIQKVYIGAASVGNTAFKSNVTPVAEYDYMDMVDSAEVQKLLINKVTDEKDWYIPIDIDENCIVGWDERYYRELPKATKGDFLGDGTGKINVDGEIRNPRHFAGLINPYTAPTNEKFKYLMDCLNSRLAKKDLGAFYTPKPYCEKASELVMKAVERVPEGNDYVIIDRCAGTGNLEEALIGKFDKHGDELISHCIVSTYEYYEYKVLSERIGDKVRNIIPPTEANVVFANGNVSNADAMSKEFIENPLIKKYVDDEKCTIILYENPPYSESGSIQYITDENSKQVFWKASYAFKEYCKEISGTSRNEMSNIFIWSGFKYYLRQPTDSMILFSPLKYWKSQHVINKSFAKGFIFNRKHFHASASAIGCILWENVNTKIDTIECDVFDINAKNELEYVKETSVKTVNHTLSELYDKRSFVDDVEGLSGAMNGEEAIGKKIRTKGYYNKNIIGYLITQSFGFENPRLATNLTRLPMYNGNGFYLRNDTYLKYMPLFVAGKYSIEDNWWENGTIGKSSDKGFAFEKDKALLKSCLIYACLCYYNKCLSFDGSDGRYYRSELCFDTTNGDTVASADLSKMTLDNDEKELMGIWEKILEEAKKTANYDSRLTYGVYQITKELNTSHKSQDGKMTIYDYPNLNGYLVSLREMLKAYYKSHITAKMFEYELLK